MKTFVRVALTAALVSGPAFAASEADYRAAHDSAMHAAERAKSMQAAWTTTGNVLKEAQKAAADRQFDRAVDLAKRAEALAHASIRQSVEQRNAWPAAARIVNSPPG